MPNIGNHIINKAYAYIFDKKYREAIDSSSIAIANFDKSQELNNLIKTKL